MGDAVTPGIGLEVMDWELSLCRLDHIPDASVIQHSPCFLGLTDEEISLVCETRAAPRDAVERDDGWRAFRVSGTLDLSLVGVLRGIADVLADIGIPVFVVSTYDTDYVLVKEGFLDRALDALSAAGYAVVLD